MVTGLSLINISIEVCEECVHVEEALAKLHDAKLSVIFHPKKLDHQFRGQHEEAFFFHWGLSL